MEIIDVFFDLTKNECWLSRGHCLRKVFQILRDYNVARGLAVPSNHAPLHYSGQESKNNFQFMILTNL